MLRDGLLRKTDICPVKNCDQQLQYWCIEKNGFNSTKCSKEKTHCSCEHLEELNELLYSEHTVCLSKKDWIMYPRQLPFNRESYVCVESEYCDVYIKSSIILRIGLDIQTKCVAIEQLKPDVTSYWFKVPKVEDGTSISAKFNCDIQFDNAMLVSLTHLEFTNDISCNFALPVNEDETHEICLNQRNYLGMNLLLLAALNNKFQLAKSLVDLQLFDPSERCKNGYNTNYILEIKNQEALPIPLINGISNTKANSYYELDHNLPTKFEVSNSIEFGKLMTYLNLRCVKITTCLSIEQISDAVQHLMLKEFSIESTSKDAMHVVGVPANLLHISASCVIIDSLHNLTKRLEITLTQKHISAAWKVTNNNTLGEFSGPLTGSEFGNIIASCSALVRVEAIGISEKSVTIPQSKPQAKLQYLKLSGRFLKIYDEYFRYSLQSVVQLYVHNDIPLSCSFFQDVQDFSMEGNCLNCHHSLLQGFASSIRHITIPDLSEMNQLQFPKLESINCKRGADKYRYFAVHCPMIKKLQFDYSTIDEQLAYIISVCNPRLEYISASNVDLEGIRQLCDKPYLPLLKHINIRSAVSNKFEAYCHYQNSTGVAISCTPWTCYEKLVQVPGAKYIHGFEALAKHPNEAPYIESPYAPYLNDELSEMQEFNLPSLVCGVANYLAHPNAKMWIITLKHSEKELVHFCENRDCASFAVAKMLKHKKLQHICTLFAIHAVVLFFHMIAVLYHIALGLFVPSSLFAAILGSIGFLELLFLCAFAILCIALLQNISKSNVDICCAVACILTWLSISGGGTVLSLGTNAVTYYEKLSICENTNLSQLQSGTLLQYQGYLFETGKVQQWSGVWGQSRDFQLAGMGKVYEMYWYAMPLVPVPFDAKRDSIHVWILATSTSASTSVDAMFGVEFGNCAIPFLGDQTRMYIVMLLIS